MKKVLSLILCIAMLLLVLVSCGDEPEHVHQYNRGEWKTDSESHWYAASCECEDAGVKNKADHVDSMNDGQCDICSYVMCDHAQISETYESDENAHWQSPACNHSVKFNHAPHADANGDGACDVCGR